MSKILRKYRQILIRALLIAIAGSILLVLPLRWIDPPYSSFMLIRQIEAWNSNQDPFQIRYEWRSWDQISPELFLAVIAAEDQNYPSHFGLDTDSIQRALLTWQRNGRLRGASTITQQVAKNLYLWNGRSFLRKVPEAYIAILLELLLEKRRILEIYANIAEFADGIYGAESATRWYFGGSARRLNKVQASRLAAVLPNPKKYRATGSSGYIERRSRWIRRQMSQLGGTAYLQNL